MIEINIARDFTDTPGGRYKSQGQFSGEEFRDSILIPKYMEAIQKNDILCINLDGGYGFPLSFLDEVFGGLIIKEKDDKLSDILILICEDEPCLKEKIYHIINQARVKIGMEIISIPIENSKIDYKILLKATMEIFICILLLVLTPGIIFYYTEFFIMFYILALVIVCIILRYQSLIKKETRNNK